nr:hypothetical protein [Xylella fastidiosa]
MEARIVQIETIIPTLATKADVESLRADLNKSAGEMRADFEKAQKENRTWMLATVLALFAGILGVGGFVVSSIKGMLSSVTGSVRPHHHPGSCSSITATAASG